MDLYRIDMGIPRQWIQCKPILKVKNVQFHAWYIIMMRLY